MDDIKILIIDDVNEVRGLLRTLLMNIGYSKIEDAKDGETAKKKCQKNKYCILT
jgi:DNA-binding NtrC family response regulator